MARGSYWSLLLARHKKKSNRLLTLLHRRTAGSTWDRLSAFVISSVTERLRHHVPTLTSESSDSQSLQTIAADGRNRRRARSRIRKRTCLNATRHRPYGALRAEMPCRLQGSLVSLALRAPLSGEAERRKSSPEANDIQVSLGSNCIQEGQPVYAGTMAQSPNTPYAGGGQRYGLFDRKRRSYGT
jgi:hypothetical protein